MGRAERKVRGLKSFGDCCVAETAKRNFDGALRNRKSVRKGKENDS